MPTTLKRKICFPVMNRIHYARQKYLLNRLNKHPQVELQLVVGGSLLLEKYGQQFLPSIQREGFPIKEMLFNVVEGGNHITMAKTAALTGLEFANSIYKLNPDIVLIRGDRFEQLAIAMVAAYMNKTVAHIEGGDLSGTIDESVRHAITKLAHIHFATNDDSRKRVIRMGENPQLVFNVGSPDVEFAARIRKQLNPRVVNAIGTGHLIDFKRPFIVVMHHPVTTESKNREHSEILLKTVDGLNIQAIWFWPNSDAGTSEIAKAIRVYRESGKIKNNKIHFMTDVLPDDFIALLKASKLLVGNSSAGIKECSYLGLPVVNIGSRQNQRLRAANVLDVDFKAGALSQAVRKQLRHGPYPRSNIYFKPDTSKKIVELLVKIPLYSQKKFYDLP